MVEIIINLKLQDQKGQSSISSQTQSLQPEEPHEELAKEYENMLQDTEAEVRTYIRVEWAHEW